MMATAAAAPFDHHIIMNVATFIWNQLFYVVCGEKKLHLISCPSGCSLLRQPFEISLILVMEKNQGLLFDPFHH